MKTWIHNNLADSPFDKSHCTRWAVQSTVPPSPSGSFNAISLWDNRLCTPTLWRLFVFICSEACTLLILAIDRRSGQTLADYRKKKLHRTRPLGRGDSTVYGPPREMQFIEARIRPFYCFVILKKLFYF